MITGQQYKAVRNDTLAVTATSREIAANTIGLGGRVNIVLRNNSTAAVDIITISLGKTRAIAGSGIVLKQGDVWVESNDVGYECWQQEIQAVCATANGVLAVMER